MNNTALRAEETKKQNIIFISEAHEKFYYEKLNEVRCQDAYHKAFSAKSTKNAGSAISEKWPKTAS